MRRAAAVLAGLVLVAALAGCGVPGGTSATTAYTAGDVVAAFRAHGLTAVDPQPYTTPDPTAWYDQRPTGNYTLEKVVTGTQSSPGLYAGVVWVANDDATAEAITNYVAQLRNRGGGVASFQHYRHRNVVLMFYFNANQGWAEVLQRYFLAFGTMP